MKVGVKGYNIITAPSQRSGLKRRSGMLGSISDLNRPRCSRVLSTAKKKRSNLFEYKSGIRPPAGFEPASKSIFWSQATKCDKQGSAHVLNRRMKVNRFNQQLELRAVRKIRLRCDESTKFSVDRYFGSLIPKSTMLATKISGHLLSSIFSQGDVGSGQ